MNADTLVGAAPADPQPAADTASRSLLRSWKSHIVAITAVLIAVPALINAGHDAWVALMNLPRTDAERINSELFRKNFNKTPVAVVPVPIKHSLGTAEARFLIYEDGEVFVEYGRFSQWFPFPRAALGQERVSFSLLPQAVAQTAAPTVPLTPLTKAPRSPRASLIVDDDEPTLLKQTEVLEGNVLRRDRLMSDGSLVRLRIDTRSGRIIEREIVSRDEDVSAEANAKRAPITTYRVAPIAIKR